MDGFARFVAERGYELRFDKFAIFQNLYRPGESEHIDLTAGRQLATDYYRLGAEHMEPVAGAVESLKMLADAADIVILTNAPRVCVEPRRRWLDRHGLDFPFLLNEGPKGQVVASLTGRTRGTTAFVDDLLHNLDSVAAATPDTHRFQHVADERLRAMAPSSPRHRRIDDWPTLAKELEAVLRGQ